MKQINHIETRMWKTQHIIKLKERELQDLEKFFPANRKIKKSELSTAEELLQKGLLLKSNSRQVVLSKLGKLVKRVLHTFKILENPEAEVFFHEKPYDISVSKVKGETTVIIQKMF